jgi:tetratricopeptide (TPR) repeat protein
MTPGGSAQEFADEEEGDEDDEEFEDDWEEGTSSRKKRRRKRKATAAGSVRKFRDALGGALLRAVPYALVALLAAMAAYALGRDAGRTISQEEADRLRAAADVQKIRVLPSQAESRLDSALTELREGDPAQAAAVLETLAAEYPDVPSLHYLAALAATQAGDAPAAAGHAYASIKRGEKVSDSLVVLSILESQKAALPASEKMGDPHLRARELLEEAIAADPANPGPRMELGSLQRYMQDRDAAARSFRAAKARLHPVDSHLAADVTLALLEVELLPAKGMEVREPDTDDVRVLFPAAFVAMRKDNFPLAIRILERCRTGLTPDLFLYLMNDPAFRRFAYREDLKPFFGD